MSLHVLLSVTISDAENVPELPYTFVGAFVVLSIEPLLVKSHAQAVIEPDGVDKSVKAVAVDWQTEVVL